MTTADPIPIAGSGDALGVADGKGTAVAEGDSPAAGDADGPGVAGVAPQPVAISATNVKIKIVRIDYPSRSHQW